jgi:type II secretory pathway pseudopilin PulG
MKIKELLISRKKKLLAAFSMVEAVVGMGILATVGGALMTGITGGFFTMQMTRENLRATQIVLEKMETIRLCSWDQVTSGFISNSVVDYYDPNSTNNNLGVRYTVNCAITSVPFSSGYSDRMRQVTFTVNWKTGNMPRTRSYTTFVARDGLQNYVY